MKKLHVALYTVIILFLCLVACGEPRDGKLSEAEEFSEQFRPEDYIEMVYWYPEGTVQNTYFMSQERNFNERLTVNNEDLQKAAYSVSKGENIVMAADISALAWKIAPYLLQYAESATNEWKPISAVLYGDSHWVVSYWISTMYENRAPNPESRIRVYDGTISVLVSAHDGHIISIRGPFRESYVSESEQGLLQSPAAPVNLTFEPFPISLSCQEQFSFTAEISFQAKIYPGYDEGIEGEKTRFDDDTLQAEASNVFSRSSLSSPEYACGFGQGLADLLHTNGYIPAEYHPTMQFLYNDNVYAIRCEKDGELNEGDIYYYVVYASMLDGHIIAIRAELLDRCEIVSPHEPSGAEDETALSEDNAEYLEAEAAFFGRLQIGEGEISELDLRQAMNTMGFDPETEGIPLLKSPTGSPFFALNLSELVPVYKTPDGSLLCRLSSDASGKIVFLVDSKDEPSCVLYYCRPDWSWEEERQTYWLDDVLAEESALEFCRMLLAIHLDSSGYERCFVLDGSEQIHWITVRFPDMKGLEYRVRFDVYPGDENRIAICNTEGRSVWTNISWNT